MAPCTSRVREKGGQKMTGKPGFEKAMDVLYEGIYAAFAIGMAAFIVWYYIENPDQMQKLFEMIFG